MRYIFKAGFLYLFLLIPVVSHAQRTDIMILMNGDHITGEVKKLEYGVLVFKTDDMKTLNIDWSKVRSVKSDKTFEVTMTNGMIYFASFDTTSTPDQIRLITQIYPQFYSMEVVKWKVVSIIPIKNIFWSRFDGKFSLGFGLNKADRLAKLNFNGSLSYRSKKIESSLNMTSNISSTDRGEDNSSTNKNQNINYSLYYNVSGKLYVGSTVSAEQNTELGIDLRALVAAEIGRKMIQTNFHTLHLLGGLQVNREWAADTLASNNLEGEALIEYRIFKFQHPKVDVTTNLTVFPGLTQWGRIRTDFNLDVTIEIFKDFIFSVTLYHKFDNRPPSSAASSNDWGVNTSIGYTF